MTCSLAQSIRCYYLLIFDVSLISDILTLRVTLCFSQCTAFVLV